MSWSSIGIICIWLMIAVSAYIGLWFEFVRRFGTFGATILNLGLSAISSPGILAGGHGAIPFPGGVAFLLHASSEGFGRIEIFNGAMWALMFLIFSACCWFLKKN